MAREKKRLKTPPRKRNVSALEALVRSEQDRMETILQRDPGSLRSLARRRRDSLMVEPRKKK